MDIVNHVTVIKFPIQTSYHSTNVVQVSVLPPQNPWNSVEIDPFLVLGKGINSNF